MSKRKILFVDRDGTLIVEPADFQIDSLSKFKFVDDAIIALRQLVDAGYELVMVSNQDGLGTESFPEESFWPVQNLLLESLASQGIHFREVLIDRHFEHQASDTRKPKVGMVLHYLNDGTLDFTHSAVIGDRDTDLMLAKNMGLRGFKLAPGPHTWGGIVHELLHAPRRAKVRRVTRETNIEVKLDLDATGPQQIATGIGFFDHMLESLGKHAGIALEINCQGDLHIDEHHTIEDCALALGQALREALGSKLGIARFGFTVPMDETLASAALDLSGRAYLKFDGNFPRPEVGGMPSELVPHFFRSLCESLGANLHVSVQGENTHHMIEACFKATARCLRQAIARHGFELASTKGSL